MKEASVLKRFRAVRLRPTVARIGVLQIVEAAATPHGSLCAEDVFRLMIERGIRASIGTIYRAVHDLEAHGLLLREWGEHRKALYRLKPVGFDAHPHRLVCRTCARSLAFTDDALQARLNQLAVAQGLLITGQTVTIQVACIGCAEQDLGAAHRQCANSPARHAPGRIARLDALAHTPRLEYAAAQHPTTTTSRRLR